MSKNIYTHRIVNGEKVDLTQEEIIELNNRDEENKKWIKNFRYKSDRALKYPSIEDQLDMIWHSMDSGEIPRCEDFFQAILSVKNKYPKEV